MIMRDVKSWSITCHFVDRDESHPRAQTASFKFLHFMVGLVLVLSALAQEPLTNDLVIKMVRSGISEDIIVSMVKSQPARYSLAPDQLIALKSVGVPDRVVAAMVERGSGVGTPGAATSSGATPAAGTVAAGDPNDPMSPHDSGIYLYARTRDGEYKLTALEQAAYQGSKTGGLLGTVITYGIKKAKMKAVIPGQHASIRTPDHQPVFYFYFEDKAAGLGKGGFGTGAVSNPNQFALVKLEVTKSSRETIIGEFGALGASTGTNEKSMVTFKSERLRTGLYKVVTQGPVESGEYCFLVSQIGMGAFGAGAAGAGQIFDFAVNPNQ
jgi:hypothetical protein